MTASYKPADITCDKLVPKKKKIVVYYFKGIVNVIIHMLREYK